MIIVRKKQYTYVHALIQVSRLWKPMPLSPLSSPPLSAIHINPKIMNFAIKLDILATVLSKQYGCDSSASQPAGAFGNMCVHVCSSMSIWHSCSTYFSSYIMEIIPEKCDSKLMPWRSHVEKCPLLRGGNNNWMEPIKYTQTLGTPKRTLFFIEIPPDGSVELLKGF